MPPEHRSPRRRLILVTVAIVLAAAMLRSPIVAVAPLARTIAADLGASATVVGLLTSIPVLAFAVCSPLAISVIRRGGPDVALSIALGGAVVGCLIRSAGGLTAALVGTAVIGFFLTIGNVVVPVVIAREFPPERVHTMTGVYTAAINIGTMTVTLATAPLAQGIGWRGAIAVWALFGAVALAVWIALHGVRAALLPPTLAVRRRDGDLTVPRRRSVLRSGTTWALGAAFAGQGFSYYAVTAWLPSLLADRGFGTAAAGAIAAIFQCAGIVGALATPVITKRLSIPGAVLILGAGWLTVPVGFLLAPQLWWLWCVVGGLAQSGGMTVIFIMISALGGDHRTMTERSGIVQGLGYAFAALGPTAVGALHEASGAWTLPLVMVLGTLLLFTVAGTGVALRLRRG